ncbi:hypothetical protein BGZ98_009252 [Dissophora globulifera]|nr:hypothetical protein BGZ98_009252 [Dissophora globulifera]
MVVHPRLVGVLLRGRSNWKPVVETDIFVLQHHPRQLSNPYRIITRGFPHYRGKWGWSLAEGHSIEVLQEELEQLSEHARVSIQGKITSKKIADLLKGRTTPTAVSPPEDQSHQEEEEEDEEDEEDGYLSDLSTLSNDDNLADTMGEGIADADPDTYSHDIGHKSGGARLIRRAISFEDMSVRNIRRGSSEMRRLLLQDNHRIDVPERPASSASMTAVPNPSDTLPSSRYQHQLHQHTQHHPQQQHQRLQHFHHEHHPLQPPYELENRHTLHYPSSFLLSGNDITRPHSAMSMRQLEDIDTLFNIDRSTMRSNVNSNNNFVPTKTRTLDDKSIRSTRTGYTTIPAAAQENDRDGKEAWGPLAWFGVSSSALDAIISWIEGPSNVGSSKAAVNAVAAKKNDKPNPILDIPFQFIALLTYPEPDPKLGGKTSLTLVRETAFVRQRRKTLLMLTAYTLVVRYCSFDFFLVLLFASNCGMLFLMKNSGRMNVNMAKRAVNQRVGWAKQWAGGLFKRGGASPSQGAAAATITSTTTTMTTTTASNGNHSTDSASQQKQLPQQGSTHPNMVPSKSMPVLSMNSYMVDSVRGAPTVASVTEDIKAENAQEENPQVKRRGLFSMRKTSSNNSSNMATLQNGPGTVAVVPSADGISGGDEAASLRTAATPKRGFFKRSTTRSATAPLPPTNRIVSSSESMATRLPTLTSSPPQSVSAVVAAPTPTPVTTARSEPILGLRSTTASGASTPTSMPSNLSQTQSLPQLQLLPMRSPSPSAVRKEMSWIKQQQHRHQPLHRQQQSLDSLPSSGSTSISSSPKLMPVALPLASPQTPQTQSQSQSYVRSLSSINPWTLLSGLSLSQRSQQQQQPVSPPSVVSADPISVALATPISPQPLNATGILSTSILAATSASSGTEGVVLSGDDSADVPSFLPFDYTLSATKHSSLPEPLSIPAFTDAVILESLRHQQQQQQQQSQDTTMAVPYKVDAGEDVKQLAFVSADFRVEEEVMLDAVTRTAADDMEEV